MTFAVPSPERPDRQPRERISDWLGVATATAAMGFAVLRGLALPFDVARSLYAKAVQVGLIERSMLANRDFELALGALEGLALGPFARRA